MRTLLLIDLQPDFCPGGALGVRGGEETIAVANALAPRFEHVVCTQDYHPEGHSSFHQHGGPWPPHCVQGTAGAELHPELRVEPDAVFPKGTRHEADSYSGFADDDGVPTGLHAYLQERGVRELVALGLATDYCVKATVLHALERGYQVFVVREGCRAVELDPGDGDRALAEMAQAGARVVSLDQVIS
ncbi:MAG: bifunctional nicotinamidase/pyrazinamidase [Deltaproteobacteria bacterium]|nr:MAG: bifunctional nicotinamidase/pyrazinamidase [Deltaproteobacteria bacterium]